MTGTGKKFESKFREGWEKCFPNSFILRLNDQMSGYKGFSQNLCDFICFNEGVLYLIECKTHAGNTFPLEKLTQYDKLVQKVGIKGVRTGVVLWLYDHEDCIVYIPISTVTKLKEDGKKSFNVKMVGDSNYPSIKLHSVKRRTFYDTDYSALMDLPEGW